ncbi:MAG: hypothetical protein EA360_06075 [Balneolaceae bacterium]|nr:MAG: hypothetical protein EA360_06075 [Balneolaceae bacterium]
MNSPSLLLTFLISGLLLAAGCVSTHEIEMAEQAGISDYTPLKTFAEADRPYPDPRVGLAPGVFDAEETIWNLRLLSNTPPPDDFIGSFGTDLAFKDNYAFQGNYNGFMVWDISDPANPELVVEYLCPASQSDVSVYGDLLFVSGEGLEGRLDCGTEGVQTRVSEERLRGIRIFDISDIYNPLYISNVQTCRGSHTHSVLVDPNDDENVYVYVSGSAPVRPDEELPGCSSALPEDDPDSALFRIEVIKVPLANPELAAIANSPRIFEDLTAPPVHGLAPEDLLVIERAREAGAFIANFGSGERVVPGGLIRTFLNQIVEERGGESATAEDTLALRENLQEKVDDFLRTRGRGLADRGPNQCHDITLYPELGLAGGACEGYGLLLDISDPVNPVRIDAVADSNFAYWHSATFNNDGTTVLFTDEWGGGTQAKCRETDPMEWGANAIYTIVDGKMEFQSYFKMPAPQTAQENCVAHNGSMIPVPGRDIMVQSWYQGGVNVFDFTDPANPVEIAYHDRGPLSADRLEVGGSWSIYWYNGFLVNSDIARGLDIFELVPSDFLTENEIAASNTVRLNYFNPQGQPRFVWPPSFAKAKAYLDQLERERQLDLTVIQQLRSAVSEAEAAPGREQSALLTRLSEEVRGLSAASSNASKVNTLADTLKDLASS